VALLSISKDGLQVHSLDKELGDLGNLIAAAPEAVKKLIKMFKKKDAGAKEGEGEDVTSSP